MSIRDTLYYGDNLDVLRRKVGSGTVDLCYIDPPFNSKRNYNQIYNNVGSEDRAQAQAFTDTWVWDDHAIAGFDEILGNASGRFQPKLVDLIKGLAPVLGKGSLLAYLVSMSLRITEIHRVLKATGSFYLHCDPTSSHYLKLVLDAIFCSSGGDFQNEIDWCYKSGGASKHHFSRKHDVLLFYTKSGKYTFNYQTEKSYNRGLRPYHFKGVEEFKDEIGWHTLVGMKDYWNIDMVGRTSAERLGYPTQKPEALLDRVIEASSNIGDLVLDVVLDAYCGCGTTIASAQRLKRKWIGIDITYQSVSLVIRRLEKTFGPKVLAGIVTDGIPRDMESVVALAHKKDDRLRKEFEKWAVLTFSNNRAVINEKKGADAGIDGTAYFLTGKDENAKIIFQVKSGGVKRGDIATLRGDMARENAELGYLITLENPSGPMKAEAKGADQYQHPLMKRPYDKISIVTAQEIVEQNKRLEMPLSIEVVPSAKRISSAEQRELL